jgi:hypothetical protein
MDELRISVEIRWLRGFEEAKHIRRGLLVSRVPSAVAKDDQFLGHPLISPSIIMSMTPLYT